MLACRMIYYVKAHSSYDCIIITIRHFRIVSLSGPSSTRTSIINTYVCWSLRDTHVAHSDTELLYIIIECNRQYHLTPFYRAFHQTILSKTLRKKDIISTRDERLPSTVDAHFLQTFNQVNTTTCIEERRTQRQTIAPHSVIPITCPPTQPPRLPPLP